MVSLSERRGGEGRCGLMARGELGVVVSLSEGRDGRCGLME